MINFICRRTYIVLFTMHALPVQDTVLNLGLNDQTAAELIKASGNPRWVYDSYRRYIDMYSDVVVSSRARIGGEMGLTAGKRALVC